MTEDSALRQARIEILESLPLFADVPMADLDSMLDHFPWEEVPDGHVVMEEGEESGDLFLVLQGCFEVSLVGPPRIELGVAGPGDLIGEAALFRRSVRRSARVQATEPCEIFRIRSLSLAELAVTEHAVPAAVEAAVLRTLAHRIRVSNLLIEHQLSEGGVVADEAIRSRLRGILGR